MPPKLGLGLAINVEPACAVNTLVRPACSSMQAPFLASVLVCHGATRQWHHAQAVLTFNLWLWNSCLQGSIRFNDDALTVLTSSYNPVSFTTEGMQKNDGLSYKVHAGCNEHWDAPAAGVLVM